MNNLDRIAKVDITLTMPPVDESSFDHILLLGPPPQNPLNVGADIIRPNNSNSITSYASLEEVASAGYKTTGENADPIGAAARIAFSQIPRPNRIFVANFEPINMTHPIAPILPIYPDELPHENAEHPTLQLPEDFPVFGENNENSENNVNPPMLELPEDTELPDLSAEAEVDKIVEEPPKIDFNLKQTGTTQVGNITLRDFILEFDHQPQPGNRLLYRGFVDFGHDMTITPGTTKLWHNYQISAAFPYGGFYYDAFSGVAYREQFSVPKILLVEVDSEDFIIAYSIIDLPTAKNLAKTAKTEMGKLAEVIKYYTTDQLETTLNAALTETGWYALCAAGINPKYFPQIAQWTESQNKIFGYTFFTETDPVSDIYMRSYGFCGKIYDNDTAETAPADNHFAHVAVTAKALSHHAGTETWAHKQVAGIEPEKLSSNLFRQLQEGNSNTIPRIARIIRSFHGKTRGGEWIDTIRFRDWLQNDLQLRIIEAMTADPKVHYTDQGIAKIHNALIAGLKNAQRIGGIAPDEWDSEGNPHKGFTTSVPRARDLTSRERHSRELKDVRFSARLAGAIHFVQISGNLYP
ncbi:MAG: DUF3383 domain-containing protein [Firmicutes bacterium]|nr:DUF3383 domain-containing protein [Bacillota bacterium]